ncbi:SURF1 family protein [Streptomyces calidiresistens]|uniref:SURF1-like protein n=1 Tax=Streptomyces calidiresistens TaxID=1485586 RepID=A0A7W3T6K3_9ACTN|nr:SURF1 family protein [Streptomyces calidiresistens]MBB0231897.1 SURF1 family protein [Streptomyces calidiresistens]
MYRFLLTPRWWAINLFLVFAVPFCLIMGFWQLGRFEDRVDGHREHQRQTEEAASAVPVPLEELLPLTTDTVGGTAEVSGEWDADNELLVPRRSAEGEPGFRILTPLIPADGGPAVPVVRGWLPADAVPDGVPPADGGPVTVIGVLQAPESPRAIGAPTGLPDGQVGVVGAASLINVLPYPVLDGWLTVREAEAPLVVVPPEAAAGTVLDLKAFQNLGYTAEWFVFAAFVIFMWYRLLRREVEVRRDALADAGAAGAAAAGPTAGSTAGSTDAPAPADSAAPAAPADRTDGPEPVSPSTPEDASGRTRSPAGSA